MPFHSADLHPLISAAIECFWLNQSLLYDCDGYKMLIFKLQFLSFYIYYVLVYCKGKPVFPSPFIDVNMNSDFILFHETSGVLFLCFNCPTSDQWSLLCVVSGFWTRPQRSAWFSCSAVQKGVPGSSCPFLALDLVSSVETPWWLSVTGSICDQSLLPSLGSGTSCCHLVIASIRFYLLCGESEFLMTFMWFFVLFYKTVRITIYCCY